MTAATQAPGLARGRITAAARRRVLGFVGLFGALAIWQAAAMSHLVNTTLTSSPSAALVAGWDTIRTGIVWAPLGTSLSEFIIGIAAAVLIGIPVGLVGGWYRRVGKLIDPWLTILNSTPSVALVPLFIFIFGVDIGIKAVVIFFFAVFPIAINTLAGVRTSATRYLRVARTFQASTWDTMLTVIVPGTVPYMLAGIRVAGGRGLVGLIVAEFIAGSAGIGYQMSLAGDTYNAALLMFYMAILGVGGVAYDAIFGRLQHRFDQWRPEAQRA